MNNSDKVIKGVQGNLSVCDLFDEEIMKMNCDFTGNSIQAGNSITVNDLGINVNEFMDSHIKFYTTDFSDLQFEYKVNAIVYSDGTTE